MASRPLRQRYPGRVDFLRLHSMQPQRYPVLLESSADALDASARSHARWDFLFLCEGAGLQRDRDGSTRGMDGTRTDRGFLDALDQEFHAHKAPREPASPDLPPFRGGWCLYVGYEVTREIEPVVRMPDPSGGGPAACALRTRAAFAYDHQNDVTWMVAEQDCEPLMEAMLQDVAAIIPTSPPDVRLPPCEITESDPAVFTEGVRRVLDYLAAGDVFQVNLSRAWDVRFSGAIAAADLHAVLRDANPAPFSALFKVGEWAIVSASPERLARVEGDTVEARPIAGTRPRDARDPDVARVRELVGHPKERAEHIMLVDLIRNDLGRVSVGGSVVVDELMTVESFAHVHHIVSNVRGRLVRDASPLDVIRAVFPGGTITGCPKVRCMQIIAELEGEGRGAYTGSIGWINRDGDMDMNILIRSAELDLNARTLRFRTGAGIVIDSDPERELEETRAKARGMLKALNRG